MNLNGREQFVSALKEEFPEVREEVEDEIWTGLLHLEMACFARFTQDAIEQGDFDRLKQCFDFAARFYETADPNLKNAFYDSYLEYLDFNSPNGSKAEGLLPTVLRQAWLEINEYLKDLWVKTQEREKT